MVSESHEQAGSRNLQALLINPKDGLALHNMIKSFTTAVKQEPKNADAISASLDSAGRSLCAAAMQSQALISAPNDADKLHHGVDSLRRINNLYTKGYDGIEDVGFWKHNILRPEKQLELALNAYIRLLKIDPEAVRDYSQPLVSGFSEMWQPSHLPLLKQIYEILKTSGSQTQGKANLLISEVTSLKKSLS